MDDPAYITSLDGARIGVTVTQSAHDERRGRPAILVHGISTDRHEGGLYDQIGRALAQTGFDVIAIDLRGHGLSDGEETDFTISGAVNDILAALRLGETFGGKPLLLGASFGGGLCIHVAQYLYEVHSMILINPRTDYRPWVEQSTLYRDGSVNPARQAPLDEPFQVERNDFHLGRCMVNELATWVIRPEALKGSAHVDVWHGEDDTTIPIDSTEQFVQQMPNSSFYPTPGAEHGFISSETRDADSPETHELRERLIRQIADEAGRPGRQ